MQNLDEIFPLQDLFKLIYRKCEKGEKFLLDDFDSNVQVKKFQLQRVNIIFKLYFNGIIEIDPMCVYSMVLTLICDDIEV